MLNLNKKLLVLPIHVFDPRIDKSVSLHLGEELESLIGTLGGTIVDRVIQKLVKPDNGTYIGSGKVIEVSEKLKNTPVDVVILNSMAKPRQIDALKRQWQTIIPTIEVWDRVDLILAIFDKHATTTQAKLQIELARMRYMGPRIYGMGFVLSRQGGGIGTSGIGETNTELMKRHWRREMKRVTDQLDKITKIKSEQLLKRNRSGFKTVSLVGYTNAGKSSLFTALTGKETLIADELFATLDTTVGKLYIPKLNQDVLITDTIGFIRNLPPHLITAFKSTLLESIQADLLLHVIDISDPEVHVKILVVDEILKELEISEEKIVYVFNKTDLCPDLNQEALIQQYQKNFPLFISSKNKQGIDMLKQLIGSRLGVIK